MVDSEMAGPSIVTSPLKVCVLLVVMLAPKVNGPNTNSSPSSVTLEFKIMSVTLPLLPNIRPPKELNLLVAIVTGELKLELDGSMTSVPAPE